MHCNVKNVRCSNKIQPDGKLHEKLQVKGKRFQGLCKETPLLQKKNGSQDVKVAGDSVSSKVESHLAPWKRQDVIHLSGKTF